MGAGLRAQPSSAPREETCLPNGNERQPAKAAFEGKDMTGGSLKKIVGSISEFLPMYSKQN